MAIAIFVLIQVPKFLTESLAHHVTIITIELAITQTVVVIVTGELNGGIYQCVSLIVSAPGSFIRAGVIILNHSRRITPEIELDAGFCNESTLKRMRGY